MGSRSVKSGIPSVVAASGRASGAPGCRVRVEALPVEGAVRVEAGGGTGSGLGTSFGSGSGHLSDGPTSSPCVNWKKLQILIFFVILV